MELEHGPFCEKCGQPCIRTDGKLILHELMPDNTLKDRGEIKTQVSVCVECGFTKIAVGDQI